MENNYNLAVEDVFWNKLSQSQRENIIASGVTKDAYLTRVKRSAMNNDDLNMLINNDENNINDDNIVDKIIIPHRLFNGVNFAASAESYYFHSDHEIKDKLFFNCNFTGFNFNDALIENVIFSYCNMNLVEFVGTVMVETNIIHSNLSDADLSIDMDGCKFFDVDLKGTEFLGTFIEELVNGIENSDLSGLNINEHNDFHDIDHLILTNRSFRNTKFINTSLQNIDFTGTDLTGADLTDADLTGANLTGTNLTGADFTRANLTGTNLTGANITNAIFTGAIISKEFGAKLATGKMHNLGAKLRITKMKPELRAHARTMKIKNELKGSVSGQIINDEKSELGKEYRIAKKRFERAQGIISQIQTKMTGFYPPKKNIGQSKMTRFYKPLKKTRKISKKKLVQRKMTQSYKPVKTK